MRTVHYREVLFETCVAMKFVDDDDDDDDVIVTALTIHRSFPVSIRGF